MGGRPAKRRAREVLFYYGVFFLVDLVGSTVAVLMDGEDWRLLLWMFWQRFAYRQLMYYVAVKSTLVAIRGQAVGWGKLERKATVVRGIS